MCFWGWIWFGRKYPSANFPRALAARRQTLQAGHLLGRNLRTSITTNKIYVFSLERPLGPGNGPSSVPARRRPRKKQGRYQRGDATAPLSAVCTVCTQGSKKSTGNLLVTLPDARGAGVKPEKQCTYWGNRVINAGRTPVAGLRFRTPGPIGTAVYDPKS